jgi:hypothetical protein
MINAALLLGGALVLLGVWIGAFSASARPGMSQPAITPATEGD